MCMFEVEICLYHELVAFHVLCKKKGYWCSTKFLQVDVTIMIPHDVRNKGSVTS